MLRPLGLNLVWGVGIFAGYLTPLPMLLLMVRQVSLQRLRWFLKYIYYVWPKVGESVQPHHILCCGCVFADENYARRNNLQRDT